MPRKHKEDRPVTRMMLREGYFQDKRSFVGLPESDGESHVFLRGPDWDRQKREVWKRDKGVCQLCGGRIACKDGLPICDPDHIIKRSGGGSDDLGNLRSVHRSCHEKRHPEKQVRFGSGRQEATEQFWKIYSEEQKP